MTGRQLSDPLFIAIAHATRRTMLELLLESDELGADDIRAAVGLPAAVVSQHLKVLVEAGLAEVRRDGRRRLYRILPEPLLEVTTWLQSFERLWVDQQNRLHRHLGAAPAASTTPASDRERGTAP